MRKWRYQFSLEKSLDKPLYKIHDEEDKEEPSKIIAYADQLIYAQFICDALNMLDDRLKEQGLS